MLNFFKERRIQRIVQFKALFGSERLAQDVAIRLMRSGDPKFLGGIFVSTYKFFDQYVEFFLSFPGCKYDRDTKCITLPTGNKIRFATLEDHLKWASMDFYCIGIDEQVGDNYEYAKKIATMRLRNTPFHDPIFR